MSDEPKNRFGVPLSRVTRIEGDVTREDLDHALRALAGRDLVNLIEVMTAQVNARQRGKLFSASAREKSEQGGFSHQEHYGVAAQIENAWKWAAEAYSHDDDGQNKNVEIVRYVSPLIVNGWDAFGWLTVKRTLGNSRIYSVELMDEKKLRSTLDTAFAEAKPRIPIRSFEDIVERLNKNVNIEKIIAKLERERKRKNKSRGGFER